MPDNRFEHLLYFFPTGTAEGEKDILHRVFVYADEFEKVISPPRNSPHLLVGTKGSGKTAVLAFSVNLLERQGIPALILTPMDVAVSNLNEQTSTGEMAKSFHIALHDSIIAKLSKKNSGIFDADYATLYNAAVSGGLREPDFFGKFGRFVSSAAKPLLKIDGAAIYAELSHATTEAVARATSKIIDRDSFYLFIDDTDQFADPSRPGHLNRLWGLLPAARRLAYDYDQLRVVVSLRSEVWQRLQRDDHGQRDQTDHFRRLIVHMKSSQEQVVRILDRRLTLAAAADNALVEAYEHFFDGPAARAPDSPDRRLWKDLIAVRSRDRPRDSIQLVNELANRAIRDGKTKIDEGVFRSVMPSFSKAIFNQYGEENKQEFPEALNFVRSLADAHPDHGRFMFSADALLAHFRRMLGRSSVTFNGVGLPNSEDTAFEVWRFLYASGVINARTSDDTQPKGYRHLVASDDPNLVARSNWNNLQKYIWEISPVYRDFLAEITKENERFSGLATKAKIKKPRK